VQHRRVSANERSAASDHAHREKGICLRSPTKLTINADPTKIFEALTQAKHVAAWWTPDCTVKLKVGGFARFEFKGAGGRLDGFSRMRIEKLNPGSLVERKCVDQDYQGIKTGSGRRSGSAFPTIAVVERTSTSRTSPGRTRKAATTGAPTAGRTSLKPASGITWSTVKASPIWFRSRRKPQPGPGSDR